MAALPIIDDLHLEPIARVLGEAVTGSELSRIFDVTGITDCSGESTKWRRIFVSLRERQRQDGCGNNAANFIVAVMKPVRFDNLEIFESARSLLNVKLAFCELQVRADGQLELIRRATTITEAEQRADHLRQQLRDRRVHPDVLRFCRAELLQNNYFHAVFEATKSVAQKIRDKTGLQSDGAQLVDEAFSITHPRLVFNTLQTLSEQSEHKGFAHLLKGFFGAIRNPLAHEPKIMWTGERDALDYLTLASLLHWKLDEAINIQSAEDKK